MRIVCLALLVVGCGVYEEDSEVGFIGYPQVPGYENRSFLITKVHKTSWTIGYYFGERCGIRTKDERLKSYINHKIGLWLAPLKELPEAKRKIVNNLIYKKLPRGNKRKSYFTKMSKTIDLFIKFDCNPEAGIRSHAILGNHPPIIAIHKEDSFSVDITGYDPFALLHELGHAMGLLDTYAFNNPSIKGESYEYFYTYPNATLGNHPPSVMSGGGFRFDPTGEWAESRAKWKDYIIVGDDKKGIEWLYVNYFHPDKVSKNECYFPTHELELLHQDGTRGCVPSNPLLSLLKTGYPIQSIRSMVNKEPPLQQLVNKKEKIGNRLAPFHYAAMMPNNRALELFAGFPRVPEWNIIQYADINIKDRRGQTPLHYAIRAGNHKIIEYLIKDHNTRYSEEDAIDLSIRLPNKMTYLHWAVQFANVNTTCLLIKHRSVKNLLKDRWGLTAKQRASLRLRHWKRRDNQQMVSKMRDIFNMLNNEDPNLQADLLERECD